MKHPTSNNDVIFLKEGEGRKYDCGAITAIFKADENETDCNYSISEWWLEPHTEGPHPHAHEKVDTFYVLEGTISFLVGDEWIDAPKGTFVRVPGHTTHSFANRTDAKAGMLNVSIPGGFERDMPAIADWFQNNP